MLMQWTVAAVLILYIYGVYWLLRRRWKLASLSRRHIRGPGASILWGNSRQLEKDPLTTLGNWIKKYGSYFGYYEGSHPVIVLTDVDTIQKLLHDPLFKSRPTDPDTESFASSVEVLHGVQWRNSRNAVIQCFDESRLIEVLPVVAEVSRTFTEMFMDYARLARDANVSSLADRFSLEVLARTALAIEADCLRSKTTIEEYALGRPCNLLSLLRHVPFIRHLRGVLNYFTQYGRATADVVTHVRSVVELRHEGELPPKEDLLQFLLDAVEKPKDQCLVVANALQFLSAFQAIGSCLTFLVHALTDQPRLQEKLGQEVGSLPDEPSLADLNALPFLDAVFCETLRFFPPKPHFVTRECPRNYTLNGFFFPAGCSVLVPVFHVHRDPQLWVAPDEFCPERFTNSESLSTMQPLRHPAQYLPFGLGPRSCIGSRFVALVVKLAVVHLLREMRFRPGVGFQSPLKVTLRGKQGNLRPVDEVIVRPIPLNSFTSTFGQYHIP